MPGDQRTLALGLRRRGNDPSAQAGGRPARQPARGLAVRCAKLGADGPRALRQRSRSSCDARRGDLGVRGPARGTGPRSMAAGHAGLRLRGPVGVGEVPLGPVGGRAGALAAGRPPGRRLRSTVGRCPAPFAPGQADCQAQADSVTDTDSHDDVRHCLADRVHRRAGCPSPTASGAAVPTTSTATATAPPTATPTATAAPTATATPSPTATATPTASTTPATPTPTASAPAAAAVTGTVRTASGTALAGILVAVEDQSSGAVLTRSTTDSSGHFSLAAVPGTVRLVIAAGDAATRAAGLPDTFRWSGETSLTSDRSFLSPCRRLRPSRWPLRMPSATRWWPPE